MRPCLSVEELASYVAGSPRDDRHQIEAHVDSCETCRAEIAATVRARRDAGSPAMAHGSDTNAGTSPTVAQGRGPANAPARLAATVVGRPAHAHDGGPAKLDPPIARGTDPTVAQGSGPATGATEPERARVGRFRIERRLGAGAMGVVFLATDPDLHRQVALKVVQSALTGVQARTRLMREAQAMAKLDHPNVVRVYEVGEDSDRDLYIAMEYVDGTTLTEWLRAEPRPQRAIIAAFESAGLGLVAAHQVGLVHRDFKPDNVLVDRSGRVKVGDFGLARAVDASTDVPSGTPAIATLLTHEGAVVGTPVYMSPEQLSGEAASERSDQYAWCVALYEAAYGSRPFTGATLAALGLAKREGPKPPSSIGGRPTLWPVLRRGLAPEPADRFDSMEALLAALQPKRSKVPLVVGALALIGMAVGGFAFATRRERNCRAGADRVHVAWSPSRKQAIHDAFAKVARPYADKSFESVAQALDAFSAQWSSQYVEACTGPAEFLPSHLECLDERLDELSALTDELSAPDATTVASAANAAFQLRNVRVCTDRRTLLTEFSAPQPVGSAAPPPVRATLARGRLLRAVGHFAEGAKLIATASVQARELGYKPLIAESLFLAGQVAEQADDNVAAEADYRDAAMTAEAAGADDQKAIAWIDLYAFLGRHGKEAEADALLPTAKAAVERAKAGDPELEPRLELALGRSLYERGSGAEAIPHTRRAIELRQQLGDKGPAIARAYGELALQLIDIEHGDEALAAAQKSLAMAVSFLGPSHSDVAAATETVGDALRTLGRYDEALAAQRQALAVFTETFGPDSEFVGDVNARIADIYVDAAKGDDALPYCVRAIDILGRKLGEGHTKVARELGQLSDLYDGLERYPEALAAAERGMASIRIQYGTKEDNSLVAYALKTLARSQLHAGDARTAAATALRARAAFERSLPKDDPQQAKPIWLQAEIARATHDAHGAIAFAEEADRALPKDDPGHVWASFQLAQALWLVPSERARAHALADAARASFAEGGADPATLAEIVDWLAHHPAP